MVRVPPGLVSRASARILLALLLLALILDFLFYTGYYASDDIGYLSGARAVAGEAVYQPDLGNARLGVTFPSAFVYWISGGSIAAVAWFHVGYHLGLVIVTYVLGRLLHGERAGLIAAALVAINPLVYAYAGAVLPDNACSFWLAGSMIAMVVTQQRAPAGEGLTSRSRARFVGYVIAGALLGLCYTCKETALIMTIPAAVFIMSAGPLRNLVWIQNGAALALGLAIVVALDVVALRVISGDWINRLNLVYDAGSTFVEDMRKQGTTPFARVRFAVGEVEKWMPLSLWLLAAGSVAYAVLRSRSVGLMAFLWWPVVYLTVGTTSFDAYLPATIQGRYYGIAIVPAAVMTAAVASVLVQRWRDAGRPGLLHRVGPALAVVLVLAYVGIKELRTNLPRAGNLYRAAEVKAFVAALELARERYPEHAIVPSPYYRLRMAPVMFHHPERDPRLKVDAAGHPVPPYLYLEVIRNVNEDVLAGLDTPAQRAERIHDVMPPRNRGAVLADAFQRVFGTGRKPRLREARRPNDKKRGAAMFLVTPREPAP